MLGNPLLHSQFTRTPFLAGAAGPPDFHPSESMEALGPTGSDRWVCNPTVMAWQDWLCWLCSPRVAVASHSRRSQTAPPHQKGDADMAQVVIDTENHQRCASAIWLMVWLSTMESISASLLLHSWPRTAGIAPKKWIQYRSGGCSKSEVGLYCPYSGMRPQSSSYRSLLHDLFQRARQFLDLRRQLVE